MRLRTCASFILLAATACGTALSTQAETRLQAHADAVRRAVSLRDPELAERRLDALEAAVLRLQLNGEISKRRAIEVLAAANDVERRFRALDEPAAPPTASPSASESAPAPTATTTDDNGDDNAENKDESERKQDKHRGNGYGHGGFDDDDDEDD